MTEILTGLKAIQKVRGDLDAIRSATEKELRELRWQNNRLRKLLFDGMQFIDSGSEAQEWLEEVEKEVDYKF